MAEMMHPLRDYGVEIMLFCSWLYVEVGTLVLKLSIRRLASKAETRPPPHDVDNYFHTFNVSAPNQQH